MSIRKIVQIDETKCNGCGECVPSCAEGAIRIIDSKARLVSDVYCDGLGACLGHCPQGAISIAEREAAAFDEVAVHQHLAGAATVQPHAAAAGACLGSAGSETRAERIERGQAAPAGACPGSAVRMVDLNVLPDARPAPRPAGDGQGSGRPSALRHWPVQLQLVPPGAPFLRDADVVLTAQCVPFALADFHERFLDGRALLIACPKLDNAQAHLDKLAAILAQSPPRSLTVIRMEVPCCTGLVRIARTAIERSGRDIPFAEAVISTRGQVLKARSSTPCR